MMMVSGGAKKVGRGVVPKFLEVPSRHRNEGCGLEGFLLLSWPQRSAPRCITGSLR